MGDARAWGCKLPNGRRHGAWHGESGAWSTSSSIGYDAACWFGEFNGAAELRTEGAGGLIARGAFRRGRPVGIWRVLDEHGDEKEVTDMDTRVVTRAWYLSCPPGAVATIEGDPHYADRVCVGASERRVGSYYSIRDLRLVERGSFIDGVRTPDAR
ncbi:MAG: hypothetical protein A2138_21335 [Deltaproteobacteria bacterium RBG_16_71_12]|nr:MAG: hypothetical protein A2138_21335 [Deltaproteobacteria bacterium RBG_16_71_12]